MASGTNSIAIGPNSVASGENSSAMGNGAVASAYNAVAIGTSATASSANSVALGANSVADGSTLKQTAYNPGGSAAGLSPVGEVSVGSTGSERRITNVAAGSADTDAVNVSQLKGLSSEAHTYTDNVGKKAYAGVASAMAMESAPYIAGTWTYAAGVGYYQQQGAIAVSVRRTSDNNRWSLTGGVSATRNGGVGARMAVTGILGKAN